MANSPVARARAVWPDAAVRRQRMEFHNVGNVLFVANTAFHQIIQIPVNGDGSAGTARLSSTGINATDGIAIDHDETSDLRHQGR